MSFYRTLPLAALFAATVASAQAPITLSVDLTDAPRRILHSVETVPVTPGAMTLVYPKWIPGEHGPTGPIDNQAGFIITTPSGAPVKWERDLVDMYSYHITVPAGVTQLNIKMDFLATGSGNFTAGGSTSANLALLSWNTLLVYPLNGDIAHTNVSNIMVSPSLSYPSNWKFGTALEPVGGTQNQSASRAGVFSAGFKTVSLEQLNDSPVLAGRWFREIDLAPEVSPKHYLDLAGDGPEDVALSQEHIDEFSKLVRETGALYASRHNGSYHFLVTLATRSRTSALSTTSPLTTASPRRPSLTTTPSSKRACCCRTSSRTAGTVSTAAPPASPRPTIRSR